MTEYKRTRTTSAFEEKNVQEFINATVDFESGITFHGAKAATKEEDLVSHLLLVGTETELAKIDALKATLPFWCDMVEHSITEATEGSVYWTTLPSKKRLGVAIISSVATRNNCAARPDLMISAVTEACKTCSKYALDIFTRSAEEMTIATSVARGASRPFSAKGGRAEKHYMNTVNPVRVFFPTAELTVKAEHLKAVANNVQISMRLIDAPTNLVDTVTFPEIASAMGKKMGFDFSVIEGEDLREQGYGGMYGVGKAAEFPAALVTLHYKPKNGAANKEKIALVGKGVVYDTGGLAIKAPATNMCGMKCDMGGSSIVFAGFLSAVAMEADREIWCVLCLADNAIGPRAQRNDDIVRLKSGITVEINNTDAEGRLVLSDGVWHASQFNPDVVIDMATLTGAQGIATGKYHAALLTDSEEWETRMVKAGRRTGDLLMPILYAPEFHNPEFSSKVADHRNSVRNRSNAQASCAGQFIMNNLKHFKGSHVHVDLAGPAFQGEQATGYGIGLLVDILVTGGGADKTSKM